MKGQLRFDKVKSKNFAVTTKREAATPQQDRQCVLERQHFGRCRYKFQDPVWC